MAMEKPTLVLDLNGTLVSACEVRRAVFDKLLTGGSSNHLYDTTLPVIYSDKHTQELSIRKRPGLDQFLAEMAQVYEIIIFSHSEEPQVRTVRDFIDPDHKLVSICLSRESCEGHFKDLRKLGKDLKRLVWLDDSQHSFSDSFEENGFVVSTFDVEKCHRKGVDPGKDSLLKDFAPFLKAIAKKDDFRESIARWKTKNCRVNAEGDLVDASWWDCIVEKLNFL